MSDKCEENNSPSIPEILADFFLKKLDMPSHSDDSDHRHKNKRKKSKHKKRKHKKSKHRHRQDSSDSSSRDSDLNSKDVVDDVSSSEEMGIKRLKKIKSMKLQPVNNPVLQTVTDDPLNKDRSDPSNSSVSENLVFYGPSLELLVSGVEPNSSTSKVDAVANISSEESKQIDAEYSLKEKENSLVNSDKSTIDRINEGEKSPGMLVPLQVESDELEPKIIHNNTIPICDNTSNDDKTDANKDNVSPEEKSHDIQIESDHKDAGIEKDSKNGIEKDKNCVTEKDLDPKLKQDCKDKEKKHSRSRSRSKSHSKQNSPKSKCRKRSSRSSSRESHHSQKKSKRYSRSRSRSRGRFKSYEHKRNSRSRNRSRSRPRKHKENSRSRSPYDRYGHRRSRSRSHARLRKSFNSRPRSQSRGRYGRRSNSRSRSRSRARPRKRSGSRSRSRSHARPRRRSGSRTRRRSHSKHRERSLSKSRHHSKYKNRSASHSRSRSKSKSKHVSQSKEKSRSRSKSKELKSSQSSTKIDQAKILETARKNVLKMMQNGTLPDGLPVENLKKEQIISIQSGGKSVQELTDFCQRLSQKENDVECSDSEDKDDKPDDETGFIHHPFKLKEPGMIKLNIKNAVQLPIKTHAQKVAELSSQFPVSSGNQHKQKELEWIPVVPGASKKEAKPAVTTVSTKPEPTKTVAVVSETPVSSVSTPVSSIPMPVSYPTKFPEPPAVEAPVVTPPLLPPPLPPAPPPMPLFQPPMQPPPAFQVPAQPVTLSYVMPNNQEMVNSYASPPAIMPPSTSIFKPPKKLDIPAIVAKRFQALTKLQENPNDPDALKTIHDAQESIQEWVESQQVPGLFTGSTDAKMLTAAELCGPKYHKYMRKDILSHAPPVTEGKGMSLLKKMGWNPGEGLGKNKEGSLEPLVLDIKMDKKGLVSEGENSKKGTSSFTKELQGKHPVSALMELCSKRRWKPPLYTCILDHGPPHRKLFCFKVEVNGVKYQPLNPCSNKKIAKADAAVLCLQSLNILPKTV